MDQNDFREKRLFLKKLFLIAISLRNCITTLQNQVFFKLFYEHFTTEFKELN